MPQDDNAAASANARQGLLGLGNFLYQNSVKKPQEQAQTAETQARTAQLKQETGQKNQLFNDITLPTSNLQLTSAKRANALEGKNLYLSQVQKPDVSDNYTTTKDRNGVTFPTPSVKLPYSEAVQKGILPPEYANIETHPDDWITPYDHSRPFLQQPTSVQESMTDRVIANNPNPDVPITRAEAKAALASQDFKEAMATLPPITPYSLPGNMQVNKLTGGPEGTKWEAAQGGASRIPGEGGQPSGYSMVNGEVKPDPMALAPKEATERQTSLNDLTRSRDEVDQIQQMINENPDLVGRGIVSGGSAVPRFGREVGSYIGTSPNYAKQEQLKQFLGNRLLDVLGQVHIGRVTELEWNQLKNNIPSQDSPKEVWDKYLSRLQGALEKSYNFQTEALQKGGIPSPAYGQPSLPAVGRAQQVAPPETGRVGNSSNPGSTGGAQSGPPVVNSLAERNAVPKGQTYIYQGKSYTRN